MNRLFRIAARVVNRPVQHVAKQMTATPQRLLPGGESIYEKPIHIDWGDGKATVVIHHIGYYGESDAEDCRATIYLNGKAHTVVCNGHGSYDRAEWQNPDSAKIFQSIEDETGWRPIDFIGKAYNDEAYRQFTARGMEVPEWPEVDPDTGIFLEETEEDA